MIQQESRLKVAESHSRWWFKKRYCF